MNIKSHILVAWFSNYALAGRSKVKPKKGMTELTELSTRKIFKVDKSWRITNREKYTLCKSLKMREIHDAGKGWIWLNQFAWNPFQISSSKSLEKSIAWIFEKLKSFYRIKQILQTKEKSSNPIFTFNKKNSLMILKKSAANIRPFIVQ